MIRWIGKEMMPAWAQNIKVFQCTLNIKAFHPSPHSGFFYIPKLKKGHINLVFFECIKQCIVDFKTSYLHKGRRDHQVSQNI